MGAVLVQVFPGGGAVALFFVKAPGVGLGGQAEDGPAQGLHPFLGFGEGPAAQIPAPAVLDHGMRPRCQTPSPSG